MIAPGEIRFPSRDDLTVGEWRPIFLRPHPDSPEQFILGVIAEAKGEVIVAPADAARKIRCLFEDSAGTVLLAQKSAVETLRDHLLNADLTSLDSLRFGFSGIEIGAARIGEARDAETLAQFWLNRISTLHINSPEGLVEVESETELAENEPKVSNDRLPVLVYHAIEKDTPRLADFFSKEIRYKANRVPKPAPQKVYIGFAGEGVVANFATLRPSKSRVMVDHVKRLMWDLARHRDNEAGLLPRERSFEMLVYRRPVDDPELTRAQDEQLKEMIGDLREQGAREDIGVQSRESVGGIVKFLQTGETRASALRRA